MKKPIALFLLALSTNLTKAQGPTFVWVKGVELPGTALYDSSCEVVHDDPAGNVISAGFFRGNIDFDPDPTIGVNTFLNSGQLQAGYVQKLDANGDLVWAAQVGGGTVRIFGMDVDAAGDIYCTGYFQGTADMDPGVGVVALTATGAADLFILKLNADGSFGWARQIGDAGNEVGYSLVLDDAGNITLAGVFAGTVDMDPGAGTTELTAVGYSEMFLVKLDPTGDLIWARQFSTTTPGGGQEEAVEHTIDSDGNLLITGWFQQSIDFDPGPGVLDLTVIGGTDMFILKLDPNGDLVWAKQVGTTLVAGTVVGYDIATDAANNVYTTGHFLNTTDFDPGPGEVELNSGAGSAHVLKLDANGDFVWVRNIVSIHNEVGHGIAVAPDGTSYTVGLFLGTPDFDMSAGTFTLNAGSTNFSDAYILKLDPNGNFVWAGDMGSTSDDLAAAIHLGASGDLYVIGNCADPLAPTAPVLDLDPGPGVATPPGFSDGDHGFFTLKLTTDGTVGIAGSATASTLAVYPNPSQGDITIDLRSIVDPQLLRVFDRTGRLVHTQSLRHTQVLQHQLPVAAGVYAIQVISSNGEVVSAMVVRR